MRILIAEDDATCRLILRKSLEKFGHEVMQAPDGDVAWEMLLEHRPEVFISDWMMPGRDGVQLCQAVREREANGAPYTYFVLLTALSDKSSCATGLEAGADDYLAKPLDRSQLEARLIVARRVSALHKENARLRSELKEEGRRDPLTRVGNRRRMTEDLAIMVSRASRYEHGFCIGLLDIDFFKKYNDSCGHAAGDHALKAVADALVDHSRSGDMVYRYGGEEFLITLPDQSLETALTAMERRRAGVEAAAVAHPGKTPAGVVTISAGVARYRPSDGENFETLVERADAALYLAKENGRNRVQSEEDVVQEPIAKAS